MTKDHEKKPHVVVAHPGTQHSHFLAVGLERAGLLYRYVTRVYYDDNRLPWLGVRYLPRSYQERVKQLLAGRSHPALHPNQVVQMHQLSEFSIILANRFKLFPTLSRKWMHRSGMRFSHAVVERFADTCDVFIGTDQASTIAFEATKTHNIISILDMGSAALSFMQQIYREEMQRTPEFAESITPYLWREDMLNHAEREVMLADYFLVGSSFVKQSLLNLGITEDRVFVVPYGSDLTKFYPSPDGNPHKANKPMKILYAGTVSQHKGISYLLEAVRQLKPIYDIQLSLCGPIHPTILENARYKNYFHSLGYVPHEQLVDVYRSHDVLVHPSLSEGFSRVLAEAMASGLPIIASTNSGFADALTAEGKEGFVIPIRDVEAIKEKIIYLYENPDKRRAMGRAAHERAIAYFSWDRYYSDVAKAVQTIWQQHKNVIE